MALPIPRLAPVTRATGTSVIGPSLRSDHRPARGRQVAAPEPGGGTLLDGAAGRAQ